VYSARYGILFSENIMRYFMDYSTTSNEANQIESMNVYVCDDETVKGIRINKAGVPNNLLSRWTLKILTHHEITQIQWITDPNAYFGRSNVILQMHMCPYIYIYIYRCIDTYLYMYTLIYMYIYIKCIHIHTHIYSYTDTHI